MESYYDLMENLQSPYIASSPASFAYDIDCWYKKNSHIVYEEINLLKHFKHTLD